MIHVTKPYLPDLEKFYNQIKTIWTTNQLTNEGNLHKSLECKLKAFLDLDDICLVNNCTNGLLMCLNEFEPYSEIITTPFSFVATTSSIVWSKLKPVFCDIDENYLFIDTQRIESHITDKTRAVLVSHIFGNTGDIEALENICQKYNLKLIFDAAHCFAVKYKNKSILKYGDASVLSFHATKVFHTIEGGAIYCKDRSKTIKNKAVKNFGFINHDIKELGINSKMSEFCCAMGLCNLNEIETIILDRKNSCDLYDRNLNELFINKKLKSITLNPNIQWNYAYYPVIFNDQNTLLKVIESLKIINIFPKRYFYPSLNNLNYICEKNLMLISESVSSRILCLPLFYQIGQESIEKISNAIKMAIC